jgi:uncharacterized DUF497 family protein
MRFEWDEAKDRSNRRKHGLSFAVGAQAFDDPRCVTRTDQVVDGEERLQTFGMLHGLLLVMVAHTLREETEDGLLTEVVRMISVRYAKPSERRFYEEENG